MKQVQKTEVVVCQFFSSGSVSLPIASSQLSRNLAFTDQENQKAIFLQTWESKKWRRFDKKFQFYLFLEWFETEIVYGHFCAQYEWEEESLTVLQIYLFYNLSLTKTWNYNNIMNTNIFLKPIWTIKSASMHSPNFLRSTYWNLSWATNFILRMNAFFQTYQPWFWCWRTLSWEWKRVVRFWQYWLSHQGCMICMLLYLFIGK